MAQVAHSCCARHLSSKDQAKILWEAADIRVYVERYSNWWSVLYSRAGEVGVGIK